MKRRQIPNSNGHLLIPPKSPTTGDTTDDLLSPPEDESNRKQIILQSFSKTRDPTTSWFYEPLTLSIFGLLCAAVTLFAYFTDSLHLPTRLRSHLGALTAICSFLLFCILQVRDGPFRRPHPAFWRVVLGLNMLYWCLLCFALFQDKHYARQALRYFDRDLGQVVTHKDFGENCDFTYENVKNQALEIFSLAHAVGWFGKALILRDWWLINILSISYEVGYSSDGTLLEYSFAHQLPEFRECHWDHWLLDVAGCNFIGSWLGMKLCKLLEVSHFSWRGRNQQARRGGIRDSSARLARQFTPFDFTDFSWESVKRFRNFASTVVLLAVFLLSEIDIFVRDDVLEGGEEPADGGVIVFETSVVASVSSLRTDHPLVIVRLAFMFLWALPAVREYYEYVNHSKQVLRMGFHAWLLVATVLLESILVFKWSEGEFPEPAPRYVKVTWVIFLSALAAYPVIKFGLPYRRGSRRSSREASHRVER